MTNQRRVKLIQTRARVRRWQFRQRHHALGGWRRFRLALAMARDAYAIDEPTLAALVAEGFATDTRGAGLEPPRSIVWITPERAAQIRDARLLVMRIDAAMLAATCLALVPFPGLDPGAE